MTLASNQHPENIIRNIMVRSQVADYSEKDYQKQLENIKRKGNAISKAAHANRTDLMQTILTKQFLERNKVIYNCDFDPGCKWVGVTLMYMQFNLMNEVVLLIYTF